MHIMVENDRFMFEVRGDLPLNEMLKNMLEVLESLPEKTGQEKSNFNRPCMVEMKFYQHFFEIKRFVDTNRTNQCKI